MKVLAKMAYTVSKLTDYSEAALDRASAELLSALGDEAVTVKSESEWKIFRDRWMARKNGILTQVNDLWLKPAPKEAKREAGQQVNLIKGQVEQAVADAKIRYQIRTLPISQTSSEISEVEFRRDAFEKADLVDISLPGIRRPIGAEHPVIKTMHEIVSVFQKLGYSVAEGPVVETDYYNFEALNFPPNHPARDTQDTLFIAGQQAKPQRERLLLRTHTSPVQIRTMEKMRPPLRIVMPRRTRATRLCFTRSKASPSTPTLRSAI